MTSSMTIETFNELLESDDKDALVTALECLTAIDDTARIKTAANAPQLFWSAIPASPDDSSTD